MVEEPFHFRFLQLSPPRLEQSEFPFGFHHHHHLSFSWTLTLLRETALTKAPCRAKKACGISHQPYRHTNVIKQSISPTSLTFTPNLPTYLLENFTIIRSSPTHPILFFSFQIHYHTEIFQTLRSIFYPSKLNLYLLQLRIVERILHD